MITKIVLLVGLCVLLRKVYRWRVDKWMRNRYHLLEQAGLNHKVPCAAIRLNHDGRWVVNAHHIQEEFHYETNYLDALKFVKEHRS